MCTAWGIVLWHITQPFNLQMKGSGDTAGSDKKSAMMDFYRVHAHIYIYIYIYLYLYLYLYIFYFYFYFYFYLYIYIYIYIYES